MVGVEQQVPLYVPLFFLAGGVLAAWSSRKAFRDPDGELRRMAAARANSRLNRFLGGGGDPQREYEHLRRIRWMVPVTAVGYLTSVLWMLVVAIRQL